MPRLNGIHDCPILSEDIVIKLADEGLRNVIDFVAADMEDIARRTGISYKELVAIRKVLLAQYASFPVSGTDVYEDVLSSVALISTGCSNFDHLLDGGLYTGEVTEIIGQAAAGKTQMCLSVSVAVVKETGQNVLYLDTGGQFDVSRFHEILERQGVNRLRLPQLCRRICCSPVFDVFELLSQLDHVRHKLFSKDDPFHLGLKLLIVDNIASVLSSTLGGNQMDGHGYMMHVARALKYIATQYSIAVLMVNNVTFDEHGAPRPALGRTWRHVPHVRLSVTRKGNPGVSEGGAGEAGHLQGPERTVHLIRSTRQVIHTSTTVKITEQGMENT